MIRSGQTIITYRTIRVIVHINNWREHWTNPQKGDKTWSGKPAADYSWLLLWNHQWQTSITLSLCKMCSETTQGIA
jgi:hypothetical protein